MDEKKRLQNSVNGNFNRRFDYGDSVDNFPCLKIKRNLMREKRGRKGFGTEMRIMERYSELSEPYFAFLKDKMENGTDEEKWKAIQVLNGAFVKMIPTTLDGDFTNRNINTSVECSPEEHEAVKQAILKGMEDPGSPQ